MRKPKFYWILVLGILSTQLFAQDTTKAMVFRVAKRYDTLKFYSVGLSAETGGIGNRAIYKVNDRVVNKATYDKYKSVWDNIDKCRPCYLKSYDVHDILLSVGLQYTDCRVGPWTEYYPNGRIKVTGHYKENHTGNWDSIYDRGYCRRDSTWTYYNENGTIMKVEKYVNDILVK